MNKKIKDQINQVSLDLRLPAFRNDIKEIITQAVQQNAPYEQVILYLFRWFLLHNYQSYSLRNLIFA